MGTRFNGAMVGQKDGVGGSWAMSATEGTDFTEKEDA